jgi:hypothetical protein
MKQKRGRKFKTNSAPVPRKIEDERILKSWHLKIVSLKSLITKRKATEELSVKGEA